MARVLVLGGNGFLGSWLVDALADAGHEVSVFDLFRGTLRNFSTPQAREVVGDFLNIGDIRAALHETDEVFHMVSTTTPATAYRDPTLDVRTNIEPTVRMLEACVEAGVRKLHFASTGGAMYGLHATDTLTEESPLQPVSPYGIGKLAIERYLAFFREARGLESVAYRVSNPYGPRQNPRARQGLIPIALTRIAEGRPVDVFGDGSMVRDYIYARDVATALASMVGVSSRHTVYNVGSGRGMTVIQILDVLQRITGRDFERRSRPSPVAYADLSVLDVSRFESEFGRISTTALEDGVRHTWEAIRGQASE